MRCGESVFKSVAFMDHWERRDGEVLFIGFWERCGGCFISRIEIMFEYPYFSSCFPVPHAYVGDVDGSVR
jgi:hypothetical protein